MHSKLFKRLIITILMTMFCGVLWASGSHKHAENKKKKTDPKSFHKKGTQKVCPIRKEKIDYEAYVDYQGQRIYFCCQMCDMKFLKNTDKYFSEMKKRGEVTENLQKYCPVSGDKLEDHNAYVTLPGRKVFLCCKKCAKSFKKDKQKYLKKITNKDSQKKKGSHHHGHNHNH